MKSSKVAKSKYEGGYEGGDEGCNEVDDESSEEVNSLLSEGFWLQKDKQTEIVESLLRLKNIILQFISLKYFGWLYNLLLRCN